MTTHTFDVTGPIELDIEIASGRVTITATDTDVAVVTIAPRNPKSDADVKTAAESTAELVGGHLQIRGSRRKSLRSWLGNAPALDLEIDVPEGTTLKLDGWSDLRTEGRLGDVDIASAMGDVRIDQSGRTRVASSMGEIRVATADGEVDLKTAAGSITCGRVAGGRIWTSAGEIRVDELTGTSDLKTMAGDIRVGTVRGRVKARTAAGGVHVRSAESGSLELRTSAGDIEVGVPEGTAAWLDADPRHGSLRSDLPPAAAPAEGDTTVEIDAATGYGDVRIRRAEKEDR